MIEGNRSNMSGWCIIWNIVICAKTSGFGIEYHKQEKAEKGYEQEDNK